MEMMAVRLSRCAPRHRIYVPAHGAGDGSFASARHGLIGLTRSPGMRAFDYPSAACPRPGTIRDRLPPARRRTGG